MAMLCVVRGRQIFPVGGVVQDGFADGPRTAEAIALSQAALASMAAGPPALAFAEAGCDTFPARIAPGHRAETTPCRH